MKATGLLAYAALGWPLAMAALPVYVTAPQFYGAELGLNLASLGLVLFLARLVDTVQDPWLGRLVDAWQHKPAGWRRLMLLGGATLAASLFALFTPPQLASWGLHAWLAVCLVVVYTAHSLVNICYLAWGARLTDDMDARSRVTAWREAAGLAGVLLASVLPVWLVQQYGARQGYSFYALVFAVVLLLALAYTLRCTPPPLLPPKRAGAHWRLLLQPPAIRRLMLVYLINSLAVALPATLVLFYIADVLQAPTAAGGLLLVYFLAGALTLPCWVMLADRIGKAKAWLVGMVLGSCAFFWAASLGSGDVWQFGVVCLLSGMALGADLALPPALLADLIPSGQRQDTGLYFGIWAMLGKLALALSAGLALPLLHGLGYVPGSPAAAGALAMIYAGVPCVLKLFNGLLLFSWSPAFRPQPLSEPTP